MSTLSIPLSRNKQPRALHRFLVAALSFALAAIILTAAVSGFSYYSYPLEDRPFHPLHKAFRPSGRIGLSLGILAVSLFVFIYLYPLRKRIKWLARTGSTRAWLDFHIVVGLTTPFLVALHSAFKFRGLAGMAFWIMNAVVASGIVGRYLYGQIPRRRNAAEMTLSEIDGMTAELSGQLRSQSVISEDEWRKLGSSLSRDEIRRMSLLRVLLMMMVLDIRRPFQVAALRRHALSMRESVFTLGGLFASGHRDLEAVIVVVRRQSWLTAKVCLLQRTAQIFQMWHVIHRPFSYAFLALVAVHLGTVALLGYL